MKAVQLPRGRSLPTGTVTFLFTDIEGSTKLVQALGDRYAEVLSTHRQIVRSAIEREGGTEVGLLFGRHHFAPVPLETLAFDSVSF